MKTISRSILILSLWSFAESIQAQTTILRFNDLANKYSHTGINGGASNGDFDIISPTQIQTGHGTFSGGATGGLLIAVDKYITPVNLNNSNFTLSGHFDNFDRGRVNPTYFGLTPETNASTLLGTGFSDNSGTTTGPGNWYWGGSFKTPADSNDIQLNARQYNDDTDVFSQNIFNGTGIGDSVNFDVKLSYNGVNTLTVETTLRDGVTNNLLGSVSRNFGGISSSDVTELRPFIFMPGGLGDGFSRHGARLGNANVTITPVPEPSSVILLALGSCGLFVRRRK